MDLSVIFHRYRLLNYVFQVDARHLRDRHSSILGTVGRQMSVTLQDDRQKDVAVHVSTSAIQGRLRRFVKCSQTSVLTRF
jgi:hypothetical protein